MALGYPTGPPYGPGGGGGAAGRLGGGGGGGVASGFGGCHGERSLGDMTAMLGQPQLRYSVSWRARLGFTRRASSGIFGYTGGHGASGIPLARSRS